MLVDVVLVVAGRYWRSRREMSSVPRKGTRFPVIDGVDATVTGSTGTSGIVRDGESPAVLAHLPILPSLMDADLRRAGWHLLL